MSKTLLIENAVIIPDPLKPELISGSSVAIENNLVASIGPLEELRASYPEAVRLDGCGRMLLPGLIDGHTHLYAALTQGMPFHDKPPQVFHEVLSRVWWKYDKALYEEDVYHSALVGSIASLRNGITTLIDHHSSPSFISDSLDLVRRGVKECGLRACLAYEVTDRNGPEACNQAIRENVRFIRDTQAAGSDLIQGLFGLHAVFSISDETLRRCAGEAADLQTGFHMHMAEHRQEVRQFRETHSLPAAEFLGKTGILGPKTLLAHTVHVNSKDIEVFKAWGAFNVHNPRSNMGNGVGIAPVGTMFRLDQPVGLGSDGFYDIGQEIGLAKLLQTLDAGNPIAFSDQEILHLVYDHNARFAEQIFDCKLGKIKTGYKADLILIAYQPFTPITPENIVSHVMAALTTGRVETAIVNGQVVMEGGTLKGIDEESVRAQALASSKAIWSRL